MRVEWIASRDCAPGPGENGRLLGTVLRVSPVDWESIKIKWDNGRVTIERLRNLEVIDA